MVFVAKLVEFFHDDVGRRWPHRQLADWATAVIAKRSGEAAVVMDPSWRFELGALSPPTAGEPVRDRASFDGFEVGTIVSWEVGMGMYCFLKLAPGCWCGAMADSIEAAHAALRQLVADYPPVVWQDHPEGIYGVLRNDGLPHRRAHCEACSVRVSKLR